MENGISDEDPEHGLTCGAPSFACLSYVDPTTYERVGVRLLLQACLCPAAVLAANASLLNGGEEVSHAHGIPCADAFAIGPHGLEEYQRICRSQLTCGFMCLGLPVIYTENLIQRQRIRTKYGLQDATSLSEIGAGCCYPCSIFQSHTFLYVSTHRPPKMPTSAHVSHGPLIVALRAMQRTTSAGIRSQEAAAVRQIAGPPSPGPRPPDQPRLSLQQPCPSPKRQPRLDAIRAQEVVAAAGCDPSTSFTAATGHGGPAASGIVSSFGETPGHVLSANGVGSTTRRPAHRVSTASSNSAVSRSTPTSSSIPPPEVTDSPRVGAPPLSPASEDAAEVESTLTDSASMPIPSAIPVCILACSMTKFEASSAPRPLEMATSEAVSQWPTQSRLFQTQQRHDSASTCPADSSHHQAEPASSVGQSSKPPAVPAASGVTTSDVSLFSLALDAPVPQLPVSVCLESLPSGGTAAGAALAGVPNGLPLPPVPTPGSSRELPTAAYDTITSSKLSSMIDHAMLNGSGSATGRGSGSAAGGIGTVLSSMDPAGPWDSCRHSVMSTIAEADAEEGQRSASNLMQVQAVQEGANGGEALTSAASAQHMSPMRIRSFQRPGKGLGCGTELSSSSSVRTIQATPSGGQRASGGIANGMISDPVCAGGATLTALARMGPDSSGTAAVASGGGSARAGSVYGRKIGSHAAPPAPRRVPAPVAAVSSRLAAAATGPRVTNPRVASSRDDGDDAYEEEDFEEDMSASADNFSLPARPPQQVLLSGAAQPLQRRGGSSQGRYGGAVVERAAPTTQRHVPAAVAICDDDEVNLASIRPSFIDCPEMEHLKSVLRAVGEPTEDPKLPAVAPAAPTPAAPAVSGSQKIVALSSTVTALQQRGSGSRRYGGAGGVGGEGTAVPYASFCGDLASPEGVTARDSVDEDASSVIDGPVSSGEGGSVVTTTRPATVGVSGGCGGAAYNMSVFAAGDASVSVTAAEASTGPPVEAIESSMVGLAQRSASGLSNGESNVGYESLADSVCASQHRQKHWVNWMAQSVGMSMANSVANSSRAVLPGYGKSAGGPRGKPYAEQTSSNLSVNQRLPRPVVEESSDGLYRQWG